MFQEEYESCLYVTKQVFCYKIPPRTTARAYRAAGNSHHLKKDWDVTNYLWTGRLRVLQLGKTCSIALEDAQTGELFASCPFDSTTLEQVSDSSRYFVLKIVDKQTRQHAFVGLGFPERSAAFDFQVALQDFEK